MSDQLQTLAVPSLSEDTLNEREQAAYNKHLSARETSLAPSTAGKFFGLYLGGHSCEEIQRANPGYSLGAIVKARLDFRWDEQRGNHIMELMRTIRSRVQQSQLEAMAFAIDGMAAYHKLHGEKFKKFLQTGVESDLGSFRDVGHKTYREFVEMLLKLTGQDKSKVSGEFHHHHTVEQTAPAPMTAVAAKEVIKGYVVRKTEKK